MRDKIRKFIIIGSSSGGPDIVKKILKNISPGLPATYIIIQHLPLNYEDFFLKNIQSCTDLKIIKAKNRTALGQGNVVVITQNSTIEFHEGLDKKIHLYFSEEENKEKESPSIDQVMIPAAKIFKEKTIGIILSGMGKDGLEGIRAIKKHGGYTIIQDPEKSLISSMPAAVMNENLANDILDAEAIANRIKQLCLLDFIP